MENEKKWMEEQENTSVMGEEDPREDDEEESPVIRFKKPYLFEGKEYTEVDLSGLEDMTSEDLIAVEKQYDRNNKGFGSVTPEMKTEYAMIMAARAAKQPVEFFYGLPANEGRKVKSKVMGFLYGQD